MTEIFRGKSVAVVGNAASIFDGKHGAEIDRHDLVIRMNRGLPRKRLSQGTRTDILAFSTMDLVKDVYLRFGAQQLIWMSPKFRTYDIKGIDYYDLERWTALSLQLGGARPSVGAMVLDHVSTQSPRTVTIYGFDFKKTKSFYQKEQNLGSHDFQQEEIFCRELARQNGWVIAAPNRGNLDRLVRPFNRLTGYFLGK